MIWVPFWWYNSINNRNPCFGIYDTLTIEAAKEYVYSISPAKRVRGWRDVEVKLYI